MVSTRSQKSSFTTFDAAKALVALRNSNLLLTSTTAHSVKKYDIVSHATEATQATQVSQASHVCNKKFWNYWTNWYHAFLSEATDENPSHPIADRRSQATSRWVTFTSKELRCSESDVRAWLRKADQKALLAAC
jgi:hypothetical protein